MAQKLTGDARKSAIAKLRGWTEAKGRDAIAKKFVFERFQSGVRVHDPCRAHRREA